MLVSDFHFDLPEDLIAQHPPATRGASRMLVLDRATGILTDEQFSNLPAILCPGDLLILNDSRVLPARLFATRAGARTQPNSPTPSGRIEVLLTEQLSGQHPGEDNTWSALVKPARKVHPGETLLFSPSPSQDHSVPHSSQRDEWETADTRATDAPALTATVLTAGPFGARTLRFAPTEDFFSTLTRIGHMPLPPYIRRTQSTTPDTPEDLTRYQTVYSHEPGSAAAPTAGLHFTPETLAALTARGVEIATLTLHVGLGTFQPVRVAKLQDIRLHSERYTLPPATADALNRALRENRRILAVGTTTTRTLEHIAQISQLATDNWQLATISPHSGSTSIFLAPGHRFRIVSGLLTNFHLPSSTLLMLVSAFASSPNHPDGRQTVLRAYAHAIQHRYRFYSYGDCMLLL